MTSSSDECLSLALGGDVMTGRGVDQILPHPGNPLLCEGYVRDAREYVGLAAQAHGAIPAPVGFDYVWGDALAALDRADVRLVNLETSITAAGEPWPGKGIHYRMHPRNVGCLTVARWDCCGLANNHVLDWGHAGLTETLDTLRGAGIAFAGAGRTIAEAAAPAVLPVPDKGRVLVAAIGSPDSGIPREWEATRERPGIHLVRRLDAVAARRLAQSLLGISRPDDVTVVSVHWGGNWGYEIPEEQIEFAHVLADEGIDIVHGHSSHHPKALELRRRSLILYGCGDLLNDYEGIGGREAFRGDLALLCLATVFPGARRRPEVNLRPLQIRQMRLRHASPADARWLGALLDRQSVRFGTRVRPGDDGRLTVRAP